MPEERNQKKRDKTIKPGYLSHSALAYQSQLESLLADIGIKLNSLQFRKRIKYSFGI